MSIPIPDGHTAFVMPIDGEVLIDGQRFNLIEPKLPVSLPQSEDRIVTLLANKGNAKAVLFSGRPFINRCIGKGRWLLPLRSAGRGR